MRFKTVIWALLAFILLSTGLMSAEQSDPALQRTEALVPGAGSYGAVTLSAIDGAGQVKLNGTTVEHLHLVGSLIGSGAEIGSLDVSGEVNLSDSYVTKAVNIAGYLRAQKTQFQQTITLTAQKAVFTSSKLQAITIRQNMGYKGKQVLELRQHTIINGPVVFEGGKGEIHLYSGSKVLGEVKGAKILKK